MRKMFHLVSPDFPRVTLRSISAQNLETLRQWKNEHRLSFFFQELLTSKDQTAWFRAYLDRSDDYMFMIEAGGQTIGCIGFRYVNKRIDIYNVIRGIHSQDTKGCMGEALKMVCSWARSQYGSVPQGAKVLHGNPAIAWYHRNGFKAVGWQYGEELELCPTWLPRVRQVYPEWVEKPAKMISVFGSSVGRDELSEIRSSFEAQWMGIGPKVARFEREFAARLGLPGFTMLDSGSNALYMAVKLLDLPAGSQVILPSFTWISCAHAVVLCGHEPVFCDVDLATHNVTAETIVQRITNKTGAIMVVHYAGLPVRMGPILGLGLPIIEDAAHAVDSKLGQRFCGSMGDIGIWSFDAVKNLASPDGGGLTADTPALIERARVLRYCGIGKSGFDSSADKRHRWWEYDVQEFFPRVLPNDVCASVALAQLRKLDWLQARRTWIWAMYQREFSDLGWLVNPQEAGADERHSYFTYCVRILDGKRDAFAEYLYDRGIYTTLRYHPLHLNPIYGTHVRLPVCEQLNEEALSLPIHPSLCSADVEKIIDTVKAFGRGL